MSDGYGWYMHNGDAVEINNENDQKVALSVSETVKSRTEPTDYHANQQSDGGSANGVGPAYYRSGSIQTWDYCIAIGAGYLEGCIIKYVSRWRRKNGLDDLEKAMHYLRKLIEIEKAERGV